MRDVKEYGGGYSVNSMGEVFNRHGLKMSQKNDSKKRYKMVCLSCNGNKKMFLVHRLVALAYIPIDNEKPHVNHKDGDKHNNTLLNLEWVSRSENLKHSYHELGNKHTPCMQGKLGARHNKSKQVKVLSPSGDLFIFGSGLEARREKGFDNSSFTYARKTGLPFTFKRGKLKGWTMLD